MPAPVKIKSKLLTKLYTAYSKIDTERDLKKAGLTYYEYCSIPDIFRQIESTGEGYTVCKSIAIYFKKKGFDCQLKGVNYIISIPKGD